jgi:hypothetical protein
MQDDWRVEPEAVRIGRQAFRTSSRIAGSRRPTLWIVLAGIGWVPLIGVAAAQSLSEMAVMWISSASFVQRPP